jgi:hypothetical protein
MGYEGLCYKLFDDTKLVSAVTDKLGELIRTYNSYLLQLDGLSIIFQDNVMPDYLTMLDEALK